MCWEPTAPIRSVARQRFITGFAAAMATASVVALGVAFVLERRRATLDRLHLMRTFTHQLRAPAMALGLDIEPLRASYDELPDTFRSRSSESRAASHAFIACSSTARGHSSSSRAEESSPHPS
jgi:site-specific recombinase